MPTEHPAITRWRERFAADATEAIGLVLTGKISLGSYDRARPAEILSQILTEADLNRTDAGLQAWLAGLLGSPTPAGLSGKRFAEALVEGFRLITLLHLPNARTWCAKRHGELRTWLRGFYFGRSRDPEAALLVALVQQQTDRSLLALWQGIVRRGRPVEHVRQALTGLRLMPADDAGKVERGVPRALLQGLLDFGDAQARLGECKGADWLMEIDFLAAVYPMTPDGWGRKFREAVQAREPSAPVKRWLDQRYPLALKPFEGGAHKGPLHPPFFKSIEPFLQQLRSNYEGVRPQLKQFFDESRHYCRESGDSSYLVRSFCFAGDRLLDVDPVWARDLAHEAAIWAPSNPHTWSLLAQALEAEGDWRRAEAIYWQARRRFPEDVQIHSQLAHALLVHGSGDLGEAVYRQAIQLFPDNSVCRHDLGHTLRILGRLDEALDEYRQAQKLFHRDAYSANALADLLIEMGRLDKAADALTWAEQIAPHDDQRNQQKLVQIRQRLQRAQSGQPIAPRKLQVLPEIAGGSLSAFSDITGCDISHAPALGKATLLRRIANGGLSTARKLIDTLPGSPEKLIEQGLWEAAANDWKAAANWFDSVWQGYEGDGVLRVHRQRAHVRANEVVDWSFERAQYPDLASIILTEERRQPPHVDIPESDELSQEQVQDAWFASLVGRNDLILRDLAEEDYLSARHMV
jgi:tetratricopeptide (TPR) repeat protein